MSDGPAVVLRASAATTSLTQVDPGAHIAHQGNLHQSVPVGRHLPHDHGGRRRRGVPDPARGRRARLCAAQRAQHDRRGRLMPFREINSKMIEADRRPAAPLQPAAAPCSRTGARSLSPPTQRRASDVHDRAAGRERGDAADDGRGQRTVLPGHGGHHVQVITLSGDTLYVEADRLLAFDGTLRCRPCSWAGVRGMVRGQVTGQGLFTTTLKGTGGGPSWRTAGDRGAHHPGTTRCTSTRRRTSRTTAHAQQACPRRSAGATWWAGRSGEAFQLELSGGAVYVQASEEKP